MRRIEEGDNVVVTGHIVSERGDPFVEGLRGVVASLLRDDPSRVKIWPADSDDPKLPPKNDGKLWFDLSDPKTKIEWVAEENRGLHYARVRREHHDLELALAQTWDNACYRNNQLGHILSEDGISPATPRARDRQVAASVIQWIGTEVGQAFLESVSANYDENKARREMAEAWRKKKRADL